MVYRNFGMPHPEGYRKALRLMKMAEIFKKPIVTLIDTPGAFPGVGAEERGQAEAIARNLRAMAALRTPIVAVVIGEGGSGGALAIGVGRPGPDVGILDLFGRSLQKDVPRSSGRMVGREKSRQSLCD